MGLTVAAGKNIDPIPEGLHLAVCYLVADMGTHTDERWKKEIHKAVIGWEIPAERIDVDRDGQTVNLPRAISERFTLSLHKKANLRHKLETWRGKAFTVEELAGFDVRDVLSAPCQLQVMHVTKDDGQVFANVTAVMPWPKGMPVIKAENPLQWFSFEEGSELPDNLPSWIVEEIQASHEWKALQGAANDPGEPGPDVSTTVEAGEDDNLPF